MRKWRRYCDKDTVKVTNVRIIDAVKDDDIYDYIFLTVRENQLYKALEELRVNISQNIREEYKEDIRIKQTVSQLAYTVCLNRLLYSLCFRGLLLS